MPRAGIRATWVVPVRYFGSLYHGLGYNEVMFRFGRDGRSGNDDDFTCTGQCCGHGGSEMPGCSDDDGVRESCEGVRGGVRAHYYTHV